LAAERVLITVAVVAVLCATSLPVLAAPGEGGGRDAGAFFDRHDANGDGKIDQDEFQGREQAFTRLDANGDGTITRDEVGRGRGQGARGMGGQMAPAERWRQALERFDQDNDGTISADEFHGPERVFALLDQDGDGAVTEAEATRFGGARGDRPHFGRRDADAGAGNRWNRMLANFDDDGDGVISREEWQGRPEMFDRLDPDGDGVITEEDIKHLQDRPAARPDPAALVIGMMDKNGDGAVSQTEWVDFFTATDEDADGLLTHTELIKQFQSALRPKPQPAPAEDEF